MNDRTITSMFITLIIVILVSGIILFNWPDKRTDGEKLSDAASEISEGFSKAAGQLEDKTLGERLHDDLKDAASNIKQDIKNQQEESK